MQELEISEFDFELIDLSLKLLDVLFETGLLFFHFFNGGVSVVYRLQEVEGVVVPYQVVRPQVLVLHSLLVNASVDLVFHAFFLFFQSVELEGLLLLYILK